MARSNKGRRTRHQSVTTRAPVSVPRRLNADDLLKNLRQRRLRRQRLFAPKEQKQPGHPRRLHQVRVTFNPTSSAPAGTVTVSRSGVTVAKIKPKSRARQKIYFRSRPGDRPLNRKRYSEKKVWT